MKKKDIASVSDEAKVHWKTKFTQQKIAFTWTTDPNPHSDPDQDSEVVIQENSIEG